MLRREPKKSTGLLGTISILGRNVGGNLDKTIEKELADDALMKSHGAHCISRVRNQGRSVLHSKIVLLTVVVLCMIDCVLVIGELILDMHAIKSMGDKDKEHAATNDHSKCVKEVVYFYDYETGTGEPVPTTEHHEEHHVHTIEEKIAHGFHYASISILVVLVVETFIKILCFGGHFLKKKFEVFDAVIVVLSLIVDLIFLDGTTSRSIQESAYILSFLLPWRVIRVVNSMIVALFDHEHIKLLLMFKSKQYLSKQIDDLSDDLTVLQNQLGAIRKLATEYHVPDWKMSQVLGKIYGESKKKKHALSTLVSMSVGMAVESQKGIWTNIAEEETKKNENGDAVHVGKDASLKSAKDGSRGSGDVVIEMEKDGKAASHRYDEGYSTNGALRNHGDDEESDDDTDDAFCDAISRVSVDENAVLLSVAPNGVSTEDKSF